MAEREAVVVAGVCAVALLIRLSPELLLRGRAPPPLIRDALPWLPTMIAGTFVGVLHAGAPVEDRVPYLVAAAVAGGTLLWRRSFYIPIVAGALTLAVLRWSTWA